MRSLIAGLIAGTALLLALPAAAQDDPFPPADDALRERCEAIARYFKDPERRDAVTKELVSLGCIRVGYAIK